MACTVGAAVVFAPPAPAATATQGYCAGEFHNPVIVNGFLEWGASDTCTGNASAWYPHKIRVLLQANNGSGYKTVRDISSAGYDQGLSTINVFEHNDPCVGTASTTYQMRSYTYAADNSWSQLSEETTVSCVLGVQ